MAIHKFTMLYKDLTDTLGIEQANKIFPEYNTLPDKLDKQTQICIASCVMQRMDESLDKDTIVKIRHGHTCNLPKAQQTEMMELRSRCSSINEFLESYGCEKQADGTYILSWEKLNQTKCSCSLFYKVNEYKPISITWCECCNGHTEKSIKEICGQPVKSEIIESISSGGKACIFKITVL